MTGGQTRLAAIVVGTVLAVPAAGRAADNAAAPTFTKDVAPIFQAKCEGCHRPDNMAQREALVLTYNDLFLLIGGFFVFGLMLLPLESTATIFLGNHCPIRSDSLYPSIIKAMGLTRVMRPNSSVAIAPSPILVNSASASACWLIMERSSSRWRTDLLAFATAPPFLLF